MNHSIRVVNDRGFLQPPIPLSAALAEEGGVVLVLGSGGCQYLPDMDTTCSRCGAVKLSPRCEACAVRKGESL
jgi:hypothetical protein